MHWKRLPKREVFFLTNNTIIRKKFVHLHAFCVVFKNREKANINFLYLKIYEYEESYSFSRR